MIINNDNGFIIYVLKKNEYNRKNADEANISRQNDERVRCVSNSDQYIIFHIMEE